jgi:Plasmid pRiA4b ORF-3-like protein
MAQDPEAEVYLLYTWLRRINPLIWRRVLVRADNTLADLHYIIQIAFSWTDFHLHRFRLHKKDFAVPRVEGLADAHDARQVTLGELHFRLNERFLYEYDFGDQWEHEVRVEKILPFEARRKYPVCIGGQRAGPPEDCGGPQAYDVMRIEAPWRVGEILDELREALNAKDEEAVRDRVEELRSWREWLSLDTFDRRTVNRRLRQYGAGNDDWQWE